MIREGTEKRIWYWIKKTKNWIVNWNKKRRESRFSQTFSSRSAVAMFAVFVSSSIPLHDLKTKSNFLICLRDNDNDWNEDEKELGMLWECLLGYSFFLYDLTNWWCRKDRYIRKRYSWREYNRKARLENMLRTEPNSLRSFPYVTKFPPFHDIFLWFFIPFRVKDVCIRQWNFKCGRKKEEEHLATWLLYPTGRTISLSDGQEKDGFSFSQQGFSSLLFTVPFLTSLSTIRSLSSKFGRIS